MIDAGLLPAGDIFELQATDATQEQQIVATENTLLIAKIGLCQTLLIEDFVNFDISDEVIDLPMTNITNESQETILEKAKESVNDVKIAMANLEVAKKMYPYQDLPICQHCLVSLVTILVGQKVLL